MGTLQENIEIIEPQQLFRMRVFGTVGKFFGALPSRSSATEGLEARSALSVNFLSNTANSALSV